MGEALTTVNNNTEGLSADLISILNTKDIFDDDFECKYSEDETEQAIEDLKAKGHTTFMILYDSFFPCFFDSQTG